MATVITKAGLAAAARAGLHGPEIKVTGVKLGTNLIADVNPDMQDITDTIWEGGVESIRYQILSESSVLFKVTLSESVGDFEIGNIRLYLESGEMFTITSLPAKSYKQKTILPDQIGNRRVFNIPIILSGIATITDFTLLVADESNVPTVNTQNDLPDALVAPYSVYSVLNHTGFGVPVLALRVDSNWWFVPTQITNGKGYQFEEGDFDTITNPQVGDAVRLNPETNLFETADGMDNVNGYMGFRGDNNTVITSGIYTDPKSTIEVPSFVAGTRYYADGGINTGKLTSIPNAWYVGLALDGNRLMLNEQNINIASESYPGNVQFATEEEVLRGTVKNKAVSPYTVARFGGAAQANELSNGQFYNVLTRDPATFKDWNILSSGTSTFAASLVEHSRATWIEGPDYFTRLRHTTVDESQIEPSKFWQKVPEASRQQNTDKVFAFRARGSQLGMTIQVGAYVNFGTGGSASSKLLIASQTVVLTTEWTVYNINISIPQLTGVYTFGSNNDDGIEYYIGVYPASSNYVDIDWCKLETGASASPIVANSSEYCLQTDASYIHNNWTFAKNAIFEDGITLKGNSTFAGNVSFSNAVTFAQNATFQGVSTFTGPTIMNNTLKVSGVATFDQVIEGTARKALWSD